jgi:type IX secretion system PorP/SprF family membrane protein
MKPKILYLLIISAFLYILPYRTNAQDIHFSQYTMAPLTLNPALAGVFAGDHRAFLNYKSQWVGMGSSGPTYRTSMFSYDTRLFARKFRAGYVGAGINAFKDVAGDLKLGTTQLNISVSGVVFINKKQLLSGGIQGGFVQKSISTAAMQWDSQYDSGTGAYNSGLASNDVVSIPPYSYGDFSAGLAWNYNGGSSNTYANKQLKMNFGLAAFHINRPNQKLDPFSTGISDNLYSKLVVHGSAQIGIANTNYEIVPSAVLFKQGKSFELDLGSMVRWTIKSESIYTGFIQGMALSMGAQYRLNDAIVPMVLLEYASYALGMSYDVNTSSLKQGTRGKGGLEVTLRFVTPNPFNRSSSRLLDGK